MLKVLIVDDEYLVLEYIKMIIEKNFDDVKIVDTAATGREAIEKAIQTKPDIVFMDIHMPGINGIEAIRQIKSTNSDIFFVILTAYEYFDYAKEALNLGVFEYLLKPINKLKLIETINNLKTAIEKRRRNIMLEVELKERINNIVPFLEGQFIAYKMFNIGTLNDVGFYENVFNMSLRQGYVMSVSLEGDGRLVGNTTLKDKYDKQNFYDLFKIKLKSIVPCIISNPLSDRIVAFIPTDEDEDEFVKYKSIETAKKFEEKIKGASNLKYKIGIGRNYSIENFNKSCNEAYIASSINNGQTIVHYEDINPNTQKDDVYPWNLETAFLNCIVSGDFNGAKEAFKSIYVWLSNAYVNDIYKIKTKLIELAFNVDKVIPYKLDNINTLKQAFVLTVLKEEDINEIRKSFLQYISDISLEIQNRKQEQVDDIISKVLEFINKNYKEDISLQDAAQHVNISYHYLSKIFKNEIGKGFTDYLTELRIEKSMQLLSNRNMSIKEICQEIGYNDPNYYCKIFKKITGMTPTEYRASSRIRGDYVD
ncbi:response regulator [Caloramator sp. ALD01]|uniref:response regulator transcription factor n=1 Tax=Caloramator sp. ALD01 TaxID=1031288 RepID=UPI0004157301|nr:response regulator [Caloramator sp. ALD01]